jgi:hypothetical protein
MEKVTGFYECHSYLVLLLPSISIVLYTVFDNGSAIHQWVIQDVIFGKEYQYNLDLVSNHCRAVGILMYASNKCLLLCTSVDGSTGDSFL